jgi:transcriptional regulator GlxA family with amidase domain
MRIEIVVFDGFDEIDALGPFEVFSNAARRGAAFDVALVGVDGPAEIRAQNGLRMRVSEGLGQPDAVLVPGGGWGNRAEQGAWAQARRGVLPEKLAALSGTVTWVASVCSGAMLLAEAGLLRGRTATTNRNQLAELSASGVTVVTNRVVDDGTVVTAGGLTAGLDLGLWLVAREAGTTLGREVATGMEYEPRGEVWRDGATEPILPST